MKIVSSKSPSYMLFIVLAAVILILGLTASASAAFLDTSSTDTTVAPDTTTSAATDTTAAPDTTTSVAPVAAAPTIASDLPDYFPGTQAVLTGANWQGDTTVHVVVNDTIGQTWSFAVDAAVQPDGTFSVRVWLASYFVSDYDVTATGADTGRVANTTFTDAPTPTVKGKVYNDNNPQNGAYDGVGEANLTGWNIRLYTDTNANGVLDTTETSYVTATSGSPTGNYEFNPGLGSFIVVEESHSGGWTESEPTAVVVAAGHPHLGSLMSRQGWAVTLSGPGNTQANDRNFGNYVPTGDTTAPSVILSSLAPDPTNTSPIPVTATFSESVSDFVLGDITLGNGTAGNFSGSGTTYTFDVTPTAEGTVTVDIAAGVAHDAATNPNTAATQLTRVYDSVRPSVTLSSSATAYTNTSPIPVTATFSESVTGFVVGDITLGNGTAGNFSGSGTTYTFDVTPTAEGTVTVDIAANVAVDAANSGNTAATQLSRVYDITPPVVTLDALPTYTNDDTPTFTGTYGMLDGDIAAVTVKVYSGSDTSGTLEETLSGILDGSGNYTVDATTLADGTYTAQAEQSDQATNTGYSDPTTFMVDTVAPTIVVNTPPSGNPLYVLNASVACDFSVTDNIGGSGVDTSSIDAKNDGVAIDNGDDINTLTVGSHTFVVNAKDNAGNAATPVSHPYRVGYNIPGGFLEPIDNGTSIFKSGRTIPVKFVLTDADGNPVTLPSGFVACFGYVKMANTLPWDGTLEPQTYAEPTGGTQFRYDSTANQYIYNWSTKGLAVPYTYALIVNFKDAGGNTFQQYGEQVGISK